MSKPIPDRVRWATGVLPLVPGMRILEVGCGTGAAVELLASRVPDGTITAIDRSARAAAFTKRRNIELLRSGRLQVLHTSLIRLPAHAEAFDLALALDVNLFWTTPDRSEVAVLHRVLAPGGVLAVLYGPSPPRHEEDEAERDARIQRRLAVIQRSLRAAGFTIDRVLNEGQGAGVLALRV